VNNETGVVLDLERVLQICQEHHALFHSDTVQSVGKAILDLQKVPIDFMVSSAHKFHGPKGVGFAFIRKNSGLQPLFFGGEQEKGLRSGTEAIHQIAGMAKALEISYANLAVEKEQISALKQYCLDQLKLHFPGVKENGAATFYPILNVQLPFSVDKTAMILFYFDMKGIFVSRGSACQSGSVKPSHVLAEMLSEADLKKPSLRISFSHLSTQEDVDLLIEALRGV
jgi:cysteine desulfurase